MIYLIKGISIKNSSSKIKGYINNIIHNPLSNKEDILKRQEFIEFLNREFIVNTLKDYPSKLLKFDRFRKLDKITNVGDSKTGYKIDIFLENKLDKILKDINLGYNSLNSDSENSADVLGCIKKYLELLGDLIYFLEEHLSDNKYIKHFVLMVKFLLHEYKLDRNFETIVIEMKNDKNYRGRLTGLGPLNLLDTVKEFLAIIEIVTIVHKNDLCKVNYNDTKSIYTGGFSPMLKKECTTINNFGHDEFLTICRAPIGSGKSFWETKVDMYQYIFSQSLGYCCAKEANLRIYKNILSMSRLLSSNVNDDLSALGLEGKELEKIYNIVKKGDGNSLIYFDETGSTTCENSEYKIMTKYFEAIRDFTNTNDQIVRIRFSTHNQKICDHHKDKEDVVFITFDPDTHELLEGEKDSNSLQQFVLLLDQLKKLYTSALIDVYDDDLKYRRTKLSDDGKDKIIKKGEEMIEKLYKYMEGKLILDKNGYNSNFENHEFTQQDKEEIKKFYRPAEMIFYLDGSMVGQESKYPYIKYQDVTYSNNNNSNIFGYGKELLSRKDFNKYSTRNGIEWKDGHVDDININFLTHKGIDDIRLVKMRQNCLSEFYEKYEDSKRLPECIDNMYTYIHTFSSLIDLYEYSTEYSHESRNPKLGSKKNLFNRLLDYLIKKADKNEDNRFFEIYENEVKAILDIFYKLFSLKKDDFYDNIIEKVSQGLTEYIKDDRKYEQEDEKDNDDMDDIGYPTITQYRNLIYENTEEAYDKEGNFIDYDPSMGFFADIALEQRTENINIGDFIDGKLQLPTFTEEERSKCPYNVISNIEKIINILDVNVRDELIQAMSKFSNELFQQFNNHLKTNYTTIFAKINNIRDLYTKLNHIYEDPILQHNERMVFYWYDFVYTVNSKILEGKLSSEAFNQDNIPIFSAKYKKYFELLEQSSYRNNEFYEIFLEFKTIIDDLENLFIGEATNSSERNIDKYNLDKLLEVLRFTYMSEDILGMKKYENIFQHVLKNSKVSDIYQLKKIFGSVFIDSTVRNTDEFKQIFIMAHKDQTDQNIDILQEICALMINESNYMDIDELNNIFKLAITNIYTENEKQEKIDKNIMAFISLYDKITNNFKKIGIPTIKSEVNSLKNLVKTKARYNYFGRYNEDSGYERLTDLQLSLEPFQNFLEFLNKIQSKVNKVQFMGKNGIEIEGLKGIDKNIIPNSIKLTTEKPLCLISGFNSSGKTRFIQSLAKAINMGFTQGYTPCDKMEIGNLSKIAYIG